MSCIRHVTDDEKRDKWARVVAPVTADGVVLDREGDGPAPAQAPVTLHASLLSSGTALSHIFPSEQYTQAAGADTQRKAYVHVVQTSGYNPDAANGARVRIAGGGAELVLREGDGAYVLGTVGEQLSVENVSGSVAEVLLFDIE